MLSSLPTAVILQVEIANLTIESGLPGSIDKVPNTMPRPVCSLMQNTIRVLSERDLEVVSNNYTNVFSSNPWSFQTTY